jgi:tight adherence protein C
MNSLLLVLVFVATALCTCLVIAPSAETALVQQRMQRLRRSGYLRTDDGVLIDEEMTRSFAERVVKPLLQRLYRWLLDKMPSRVQQDLEGKLAQAGNTITASHMIGLQALTSVSAGVLGLLLVLPVIGEQPLVGLMLSMVMMVLGWRLPQLWLSRRITARRHLIDRALPDVLDLLSVSVEAGLGLDGAIQKVGEKFSEPTAGEFRELLKAIRLGTPRPEALRGLAKRTGLPEMRTFAAAVIQAEQLGVSISRVLRNQSQAVRTRRRQKVEEKAMALPVKMLFPLILFIFPTVFIVVLGPVVISMMTSLTR